MWVADNGSVAAALMTDCAYLGASARGGSSGDDGPPSPTSSSAHTASSSTASSSADTQALQCVAILWGHETPVICVSLSTHLDLLASGSVGGAIVLHQVSSSTHSKLARMHVTCVDMLRSPPTRLLRTD